MQTNQSYVLNCRTLYLERAYLFLFGVELKALSEGASLRLQVLLLHLTHTLSVRDVLVLRSLEQTADVSTSHREVTRSFKGHQTNKNLSEGRPQL